MVRMEQPRLFAKGVIGVTFRRSFRCAARLIEVGVIGRKLAIAKVIEGDILIVDVPGRGIFNRALFQSLLNGAIQVIDIERIARGLHWRDAVMRIDV